MCAGKVSVDGAASGIRNNGEGAQAVEEESSSSTVPNVDRENTVSNIGAIGFEIKKEGADESDDYRSECENCNMRQTPGYEEDLVTMTLHRRTGEQADPHFYSRTSLTLPTHPRKQLQRYLFCSYLIL